MRAVLVVGHSIVVYVLRAGVTKFNAQLGRGPVFLVDLRLFHTVGVTIDEGRPGAACEVANRHSTHVDSSVGHPANGCLQFYPRFRRFIFVVDSGRACAVKRVLVRELVPSRVGFGSLVASLAYVAGQVVDASHEGEGERVRRSVFHVLCVPVDDRDRAVARNRGIGASVHRHHFFPFSVQVDGHF